jgi:hypothetical protein
MEAATAGSSMLTEAPPLMPGSEAAPGGTPAPARLDGAEAAVKDAIDAPPEWAPAKYWDPKTKSVKTEDLGKAYINLEKLLGREKVPVPVSEDDAEGWERLYRAAGKPEKPDDYQFKRPEKLPDGLPYDEDTEKAFKDWAHMNGLNKKQAANLYDAYVKTQIERHAAWDTQVKQTRAQAEMALRREFGNGYEQKLNQAKMALRQYADPDYFQWLDESGQGNSPQMIRVWARIGEQLGGETRLQGRPQAQANPADLDRAIAEFRDKHKEALFTRDHPDHGMRVKEYNKLFEARFGE